VTDARQFHNFLEAVLTWARARPDLLALAVVGSHARGRASQTSDIDLVLIVQAPGRYIDDKSWLDQLGTPSRTAVEHWGAVTSLRVFFQDGPEVDFAFSTSAWCCVPLDPGTRRVLRDGCQPLFDPTGILADCLNSL
jgi:predicted nucleotidyltransferase